MQDGLTVDRTWETADGFLGFSARFARTGIQHYLGSQIDPEGSHVNDAGERRFKTDQLYPVQRDAAEVFAPRAMGSFIAKPITNDHPSEGVNASNWGKLAKGAIGEVLRDGEYARMSGLITDAATIADYRAGKRELSGGYQTNIVIGDGVNDKGEAYVARQTTIDGNHVALVLKGRAGAECAIRDSVAICDSNPAAVAAFTPPPEKKMKITIGDAKDVDLSDGAAVALAVGALNTSLADAQTKVGTLTADLATANTSIQTKDGEIAALNAKLKDAEVTPERLQALADARADVIGKAKLLAPNLTADGKTDADIRKEAVIAKLGDSAKDMADAAIEGAFVALTKDAKPAIQPLGQPKAVTTDAAAVTTARSRWLADKQTAYRGQPA